jgi:uncharacterized protein YecE (DUF72 family)
LTATTPRHTRSRTSAPPNDSDIFNTEDELKGWVTPIRGLAEKADQIHAPINNCYADYGVRNARQRAELAR